MIVVRSLYGLKSAGAAFGAMRNEALRHELGFTQCRADPDVWFRAATKPDGEEYYEYVLCYVDDLLFISHDPKTIGEKFGTIFKLKKGSKMSRTDPSGALVQTVGT